MPKEVDAITKLYDLLLWIIPKLERFPRSQKFLIGDRIETVLLDVLDLLIEAAYSKKKSQPLRSANLQLEKVRYLVRLSKNLKLLSLRSYELSARSIDGVGTSIGGWLKYSAREDVQGSLRRLDLTQIYV
jgi:hypothetical protein